MIFRNAPYRSWQDDFAVQQLSTYQPMPDYRLNRDNSYQDWRAAPSHDYRTAPEQKYPEVLLIV